MQAASSRRTANGWKGPHKLCMLCFSTTCLRRALETFGIFADISVSINDKASTEAVDSDVMKRCNVREEGLVFETR